MLENRPHRKNRAVLMHIAAWAVAERMRLNLSSERISDRPIQRRAGQFRYVHLFHGVQILPADSRRQAVCLGGVRGLANEWLACEFVLKPIDLGAELVEL